MKIRKIKKQIKKYSSEWMWQKWLPFFRQKSIQVIKHKNSIDVIANGFGMGLPKKYKFGNGKRWRRKTLSLIICPKQQESEV
jgi:hypothetical protein